MHRDRRAVAAGLLVTLVLLALPACGDGTEVEEPDAVGDRGYGAAATALCDARDAAGDGDLDTAQDRFFGDAHDALHELASEVAEVDRSVAATVLRTKQAVEAALADPPPAEVVRERLAALVTATRDAISALGSEPPSC